jgi:hypothetical protein
MADHTPGLTGIGYAHAAHTSPNQPRKPSTIQSRWDSYWSPRALLAAKHDLNDPVNAFCDYHVSYRRRLRNLLAAKISWKVILAGDLDSPLQSGTEFDRALCLAIERRRRTLGRENRKVKGKNVTHSK